MKDKNNNQASYDFKRIKWKEGYTFLERWERKFF